MICSKSVVLLLGVLLAGSSAGAGDLPGSALELKERGDAYLEDREYGAALDAYAEAIEYVPWYAAAHYNLGAVYLKGFRRYDLAAYHFEMYAIHREDATDHARVSALVNTLKHKAIEKKNKTGVAPPAAVGRRLLVPRPEDLRPGQEVEISVEGAKESIAVRVAVSYPGWILTDPIPDGSVAEAFVLRNQALASRR